MKPLKTGITLGVTVGVFYALCSLAWWVAPDAFMNFMNNLFHGLDFSVLRQARPFVFSGFLSSLLILSFWTFLAGVFFAWLSDRISPQ